MTQHPGGADEAVRGADGVLILSYGHTEGALRRRSQEAGLYNVAPLAQIVASSISPTRIYAALLAVFAVVALALAATGLYGTMTYFVAHRTREIGIRTALGALRDE